MHGLIFETSICCWQDQPVNCRTKKQMGKKPWCFRIFVFQFFSYSSTCDDYTNHRKGSCSIAGEVFFTMSAILLARCSGRRTATGMFVVDRCKARCKCLALSSHWSINVVQRTDARHSHNNSTCNKTTCHAVENPLAT